MVANITGVKAIVISIFTTMELLSGIKDKEKQKKHQHNENFP